MQRRTVLGTAAMGLIASAFAGPLGAHASSETEANVAQAYRILNDARQKAGLSGLTSHPVLETLVDGHAFHMQTIGHTTHLDASGYTADRRAAGLGYKGRILGETLAHTYGSPTETVDAWLEHSATREVLMADQAHAAGLAVAQGLNGSMWWAAVVSDA